MEGDFSWALKDGRFFGRRQQGNTVNVKDEMIKERSKLLDAGHLGCLPYLSSRCLDLPSVTSG